ncbi:protein FAR-RED IMPAIRED RESPONSE 1-like [Mercurialis annua]|uniref:protein FAR-RED IMPAIRED RESPONSE 1-like n=1 Tax=Mercurialis annua TaxID=3986 RepID=UPI0024AF8A03|nr:protein FAR-RED IMPAIRED RESPONSE 1-like [Mercurialis annua]
MQKMDPSFFYAVQLDANDRIKNCFWRDGKSKIDYDHFGDVLIFDTTFKMDNHGMICAPFMGLNHHRQYVLFGCAFLLDESIDSLIWLDETFKDAMGGRQPKTIFTDLNQATAVAVEKVFPEAKHQFGLWHILRNSTKYLSKSYAQNGFESLFNEWISGCQTEEEFNLRWISLLQKFNLHNNSWLNTLYKSREKWAPLFSKNTFRAGIPDSVNINGIFQKISENSNLLTYVQQYLNAADRQRRKESYEDFYCKEKAPKIFLNDSLVEKQAARIYTSAVFKLFQRELLKCFLLTVEEISCDGWTATFKVAVEGQKGSIVEFDRVDSNVTCSCRKYESDGVLCMHALKVLDAKNIFHIPVQYRLKRWTKSAKDYAPTGHEHRQDINGNQPPSEVTKSNDCGLATGMSKGVEISIFNNA